MAGLIAVIWGLVTVFVIFVFERERRKQHNDATKYMRLWHEEKRARRKAEKAHLDADTALQMAHLGKWTVARATYNLVSEDVKPRTRRLLLMVSTDEAARESLRREFEKEDQAKYRQ